ncbi:Holliday junction ATP-dependent DNA helicase RuvB [archaeon HR06]|nr:Holliday junction ATP-dependent DNA helicase RuvB [archaeon HR06]
MLTEKYRPNNPFQLVGNEEVRVRFIKWLKDWKKGSKPALLIGPPGIGKTTLVYSSANFLNYKVIELNASDIRTKGRLESILKPSLIYFNLFGERVLAFLDEVDGIYSKQDYGGMEFLLEAVKMTQIPLVFAANIEDEKIKKLIEVCEVFRMKKPPPRLIEIYLKNILKREKVEVKEETIREIVKKSKGDVRNALNNLQLAISGYGDLLAPLESNIPLEEGINRFFQAKEAYEAYEILSNIKAEPREKIRALYNTLIGSEISEDLKVKALRVISYADEILNRILKTQEWRQLKYLDRFLAFGLKKILKDVKITYKEDTIPWNLKLRIWNDSKILKDLANYLSKQLHTSKKEFMIFYYPLLPFIFKDLKDLKRLGLNESMIKVLKKEK